jgi:hypothetical protein
MAKIVKLGPDGSYIGLVDREEQAPELLGHTAEVLGLVSQATRRLADRLQVAETAQPAEPDTSTPAEPEERENAAESVPVSDLSYHELRAEAKLRGLVGYSHMKKDELVALVEAARG